RTGDLGALALVFHDRTQIRVHRNSSLIVKAVSKIKDNNQSVFELKRGGAWARSPSGGAGVAIETPSATAAIRGTDWSLTVDAQGRTTLIVLSGEVVLTNPLGSVTVTRGEIAFAEIGKAPSKTVLVAPSDRVQVYYNMSLAEALRLFPVTDLKTRDRRMARKAIESLPESRRTPIQLLDLAELAHDMGDMPEAFRALSACPRNPETAARMDLIKGYLAVFKDDFKNAIRLFENAEPFLDPDRRVAARIGRAGSLLLTRQADAAKGVIRMMEAETPDAPRFLMFKVMLAAFSGDLEGASALSSEYGERFPDQALFPAMKGLLALLLDRREEAREASRQVLAIDPEHSTGYFIEGHYRAYYLHDSEGAADIVQQGLSFNENSSDLWGALGWIYLEMGEARKCEEALHQALRISPNDMADLFNYLLVLLDQHR
ncbi:MAG: FecR domain-containing protein, partial [Desulfosalsimonadaceae bacterium]|nr:FecR domain-containing protein [Desulfosalsimonadaceae bacterium]